jgi:chromosome segregation protein
MKIKSLEIHGFKSFPERTKLHFGRGVTGVVGPNGCGKSNIIDAIRWAMGEMSAKHLRGRGMQDVIFAGCDTRGPSGFAEVTLSFENDGNTPPQYAAYSEIAITRRLHRDNTSDYLINKSPCRLRDITDFFLGTGVGTRAYSIIEQGRIGFIVNSRPEDRRGLIEEVAGISKFKARRKAAERRMVATEHNLARVNDIVTELERQLGSLQRQAKKALRYQRVKNELRDIELHLASADYLKWSVRQNYLQRQNEDHAQNIGEAQNDIDSLDTNIESKRLAHLEHEQHMRQEQEQTSQLENRLVALDRDVTHWQTELTSNEQRKTQASQEVEDSRIRQEQVQKEKSLIATQQNQWEALIVEGQNNLETQQQVSDELQANLLELDDMLTHKRERSLETIHDVAKHRSVLSRCDEQLQTNQRRRLLLDEELAQVIYERKECEETILKGRELRDALKNELDSWTTMRHERQELLGEVKEKAIVGEQKILQLRGGVAETKSRLDGLKEIAQRLEGHSQGVRTLLGQGSTGEAAPSFNGLLGLVSDILITQPQYEKAIESFLGEKLQLILVERHDVAEQAIAYLKENEGGRGGFLLQSPAQSEHQASLPATDGVLAWARDAVQSAPGYDLVLDLLFEGVGFCEDLPTALNIWGKSHTPLTLVTLSGDVVGRSGVVWGGEEPGGGLLTQAREIRDLSKLLLQLEQELDTAQNQQRQLEKDRLQHEIDVQQLDKDIRRSEMEHLELTKDVEASTLHAARLSERVEVLQHEQAQLKEEIGRFIQDRKDSQEFLEKASVLQEEHDLSVSNIQTSRQETASTLEERQAALTLIKVQLASQREKQASSKDAILRLNQSEAESEQRLERNLQIIDEASSLELELNNKHSQGVEESHALAQQVQKRTSSLREQQTLYGDEQLSLSESESRLKTQRRGAELLKVALNKIHLESKELELRQAQIATRIQERYDIALRDVVSDYHLRPMPAESNIHDRERLEKSLKTMGSINLMAIEECREIEERHEFLSAQENDLVSALDKLKKAIQRINRTSRQRFKEAFEAVNQTFQELYPKLFRGGEARLVLLPHEDVLESGIDIVAQPPGKKLQNVSLLSGGEKALTATALVFAIFLIKPSPFCVLDEVDAPLDDANVNRFNAMLREISKTSQFIVITHNKLTMAQTDRLYGITMEEPGMSKLVRVDFDDDGTHDDHNHDHVAA